MTEPPTTKVPLVLRCLGLALLVVGALGYLVPAPPVHWTALIPAALGVLALLSSLAGRWPQVAAAVGSLVCAVALAGGASALADVPAVLAGEAGAATISRAATAAIAIIAIIGLVVALRADARRNAA